MSNILLYNPLNYTQHDTSLPPLLSNLDNWPGWPQNIRRIHVLNQTEGCVSVLRHGSSKLSSLLTLHMGFLFLHARRIRSQEVAHTRYATRHFWVFRNVTNGNTHRGYPSSEKNKAFGGIMIGNTVQLLQHSAKGEERSK